MATPISLEGPVELIDGKMILRIPLTAGGDNLISAAGSIGNIDSGNLNISILPWLANQLKIGVGSLVVVDNIDGKLRITRSAENDA